MKNLFLIIFIILFSATIHAANQSSLFTVTLKYIDGDTAVSVLKSLLSKKTKLSAEKNILIIDGSPAEIKKVTHVLKEIDQLPAPLTLQFIASSRKLNLNSQDKTFTLNQRHNTAQSMSIVERQWVTLNTGISVPIAVRKKYSDGTEAQTFRYKKISKKYVFKVHEFSGWTIVQVGMDSDDLMGPGTIIHSNLETTIVGKTGNWLEVATTTKVNQKNGVTYSTASRDKKQIHLYVRVIKQPESEKNAN